MYRSFLIIPMMFLILSGVFPVYSLEVLYNVDDAAGDVEPFLEGHDINNYVSRIDITNAYVYIDDGAVVFELTFSGNPITPDEAVSITIDKNYEYQFQYTVTVLIGGVLSKIQIVSEYGTTTHGGMERMYMRAVVMILRGEEWLIPYLERNITISGNKMIIDIPLLALEGLDLRLPEPSQQSLYVEIHVMSPMDMATIIDELEFIGGAGTETTPSGPTAPTGEETTEEEVETGIPYTWIAVGGIALIIIVIILLKIRPATKFIP